MPTVRNPEERPILVAQAGPFDGQRWILQEHLVIGRDAECDIVIPNRQVSRQHARFSVTENGVYIEDLGSKNGTHVNGEELGGRMLLQDGDVVQIALTQQFVFLSSDATIPLEGGIDLAKLIRMPPETSKLKLDKRSRRVWIDKNEIIPPLSVAQFNLLEILYNDSGQVVPRTEIIHAVWGEENAVAVSDQALDALVRRLRDRLAEADPSHEYVVTVRGHGLRLENPVL